MEGSEDEAVLRYRVSGIRSFRSVAVWDHCAHTKSCGGRAAVLRQWCSRQWGSRRNSFSKCLGAGAGVLLFTVFCVGGGIGFMNNLGLTQRAIWGLN